MNCITTRLLLTAATVALIMGVALPNVFADHKMDAGYYGGPYENFGTSVATYQNWLVVGAPGDEGGMGAIYVYQLRRNYGTFEWYWSLNERFTTDSNCGGASGSLGESVDIHGEFIVAGAPGCNNNEGLVYVFERSEHTGYSWSQVNVVEKFNIYDPPQRFGTTVSLDGDWLAVGCPSFFWYQGRTYVYKDNWQYDSLASSCANLSADEPTPGDEFGHAVDITVGPTWVWVISGAPGTSDVAWRRVYRRVASRLNFFARCMES